MKQQKKYYKSILSLLLSIIFISLSTFSVFGNDTNLLKFADINMETQIPTDLITYTRSTSYNNSKLELIGVSNIEELKSLMVSNNIYLEAVPEDVSYEIIVSGKDAGSNPDFDTLSESELNSTFEQYVNTCNNIDNESVTEKVTASSIYKTDAAIYFQVDVKSIANNNMTIYLRKYYTVKMGKAISFVVQSNGKELNDTSSEKIATIVDQAQYKTIKKSIWENEAVSEIGSTLVNILIPILFLLLVFFVVKRSTQRTKKQIEQDTERLKQKHLAEEQEKQSKN